MMDGRTGGRRDWGAGGSHGNWQAWLCFCFLLTASSHIMSSDAGRSNLSSLSLPLRPPLFLPWPLNYSPAGPSFAHAVSGCLFAWLCLRVFCENVCVWGTHTYTHAAAPGPWPIPSRKAWRLSPSGHLEVGILQSAAAALWLDYVIWLGRVCLCVRVWVCVSICVCLVFVYVCACNHKSHIVDFIYTPTKW